jgi:prepilin-type N-terminal cleavage/methylation domain-containing protein
VHAQHSRGFTLIEILAVILIFALIAGVMLPRLGLVGTQALRDSGGALAAALDFARERAQATGRAHRVVIDFAASSYWIEERAPAPPIDPALAWAELDELPLVAPRSEGAEFARLPGESGPGQRLDAGCAFVAIESERESLVDGLGAIAFDPDGSTSAATIRLARGEEASVSVEVAPFADPTQVSFDAP